ncbi:2-nonaprenyl-3-methyl-6-methoxy-1,4-benzoquinol hydroxylase [Hypericibacter adhaerens]|jgi:ubiquinone biosynthesis monooxygenase Coq7|uniref:3-demethoxyubiquinol 3-hydroxylase n=1 Tax=Hypericibacter adhaerens TaxID=2602016 RepID=A0A5J6N4T4_9PROT|nr:demethoxyubiquinone hydroxylase family protein [Hypericibacter adhaerens]QEX24444.1 2-nonaprenyl-3-methyl-6-methoxy-1,4-benzoquinol hydroxylase [Hypericibacter adhaerens]HVY52786.1 demethoxyubiquinone hydroxylase family protein [Devosia sp.]
MSSDDFDRPGDQEASESAGEPRRQRLPGDLEPEALLDRIIRVDQAGEYGAKRIYEGQMAVLGPDPKLKHMAEQERQHLQRFNELLIERRARPTLLQPFWHVAGFALGAATAMLGREAAMACTVAVEEVIDEHYRQQMAKLPPEETALKAEIDGFRQEELEHRAIGLAEGAERAPAYPALTAAVKAGSRLAIWIAERV